VVGSDWLVNAETLFTDHPEIDMAFGILDVIDHDPGQCFVTTVKIDTFRLVQGAENAHIRGGAGANMVARRSLFDLIGRYDEEIGPGSRFEACEEYDVYYRALAGGAAVAFAPSLRVTHCNARSYADGTGQRLKRKYAYGEGTVLGKHLRLRDVRMLPVAAHIFKDDLSHIADSLRHRRLAGTGTFAWKLRGVAAGTVTRVDRRQRLFVPRNSGQPS
jgi:hypothetical protein